jgi:hypothetical protein
MALTVSPGVRGADAIRTLACDIISSVNRMCESEATKIGESQEREVRMELNRLLESVAFRTSKRCREFLEYIVERTINGPSGALKERSIGVELFQLPQDFDTGQHTIVRVTANEVRKKLAQHYLAENGAYHPVRIDLPPGSYSAVFTWGAPAAEAPLPAAPVAEPEATAPAGVEPPISPLPIAPERPHWPTRPMIAAAAALLVVVGAIWVWRWRMAEPASVGARSPAVSQPGPVSLPGDGNVRLIVGSTSPYLDRTGRTWGPDRFFSGGTVLVRSSERILRTLDPDIYRHVRLGEFRYDIPLEPGSYELRLHFAETGLADFISAESSGEGQRIFRVSANGKTILDYFDVVSDAAGANTADERVFRDISPAPDGLLHLSFAGVRGSAMLSGIEIIPMNAGRVRPVRIRAGWTSSWQDSSGQQWQADSFFLGGNALVRTTNPAHQGGGSTAPDTALYTSERWGHFSYAVPVADGRYRVTLKFLEGHYGRNNTGVGGAGSRLFDVYCNGLALLRNFDIFKEAGSEGKPVDRTFSGIRPTAQGKIVLTFVPIEGMACVNGIEVVDDSK